MQAPTEQDVSALLDEVTRFVQRDIAPLVERHEVVLPTIAVARIGDRARELGILGGDGDEDDVAVWARPDLAANVQVSVGALRRVARASPGVAWSLHQRAFARWLIGRLGWIALDADGPVAAIVQGSYGLARCSLACWLRGADLDDDDRALLADYFEPEGGALLVRAPAEFRWMVAPAFGAAGVQWRAFDRDHVEVTEIEHSLGLDEVPTLAWRARRAPVRISELAADAGCALYATSLQLTALALIAIGLGAVDRAGQLAADYARVRRQGGKPIERHPAVQQLLGSIQGAVASVSASLERAAARPVALEHTAELMLMRAEAHATLCRAANDAVQVLGGIGYMRDAGVEKLLRDSLQLRALAGTPTELRMFAAEWSRHP